MGILHQFEIANNGQSSAQFGMSNPSDNAYISQLQGRPSVSVAPTSSQAHRTASGSHLNQINYSTAQGNSKRTPLPTRKAPVAVMVSKMSSSQPIQKVKKQPSSISCEPCKRAYIKCDGTQPICRQCIQRRGDSSTIRSACVYDLSDDKRKKTALRKEMNELEAKIARLKAESEVKDAKIAKLQAELGVPGMVEFPNSHASGQNSKNRLQMMKEMVAIGAGQLEHLAAQLSTAHIPHTTEHSPSSISARSTAEPAIINAANPAAADTISIPAFGNNISNPSPQSLLYLGDTKTDISPKEAGTLNQWTNIKINASLIRHLMALYFTWSHPLDRVFVELCFRDSLMAPNTFFCSESLVNVILSIGCVFWKDHDSSNLGNAFYDEAKHHLSIVEKLHNRRLNDITTLQTMALISIRQRMIKNQDSADFFHNLMVQGVLELGLNVEVQSKEMSQILRQNRNTTFWACYNLETSHSLFSRRLSNLPANIVRGEYLIEVPYFNQVPWNPYGMLLSEKDCSLFTQPSHAVTFENYRSQLSALLDQILELLYGPKQADYPHERITKLAFSRLLIWYESLPAALSAKNRSTPSPPHVIALHAFFYHCTIALLQPYISFSFTFEPLQKSAAHICEKSIGAIHALVNYYENLYGKDLLPIIEQALESANKIAELNSHLQAQSGIVSAAMGYSAVADCEFRNMLNFAKDGLCRGGL